MENKVEDPGSYEELLANIRRLAIMLLDSLEEGLKNGTLDPAQKRLLSSTGARLLRLWKNTVKEKMTLAHGKTSDWKEPGLARSSGLVED